MLFIISLFRQLTNDKPSHSLTKQNQTKCKNVVEDCKDKLIPWQLRKKKYKMCMFEILWINEKDDIYFFSALTILLTQNTRRN